MYPRLRGIPVETTITRVKQVGAATRQPRAHYGRAFTARQQAHSVQ